MDIKNADLNLLRALDALLAERNVSRAALRLHLSQPATSALLSRLRDVLKDPLLVRSGRGMVPTPRALALIEPVRKLLVDVQDILQPPQAFDPQASERVFTLATTEYVGLAILPALSRQLAKIAPNIRIALVAPNVDTMVREMETGALDAAVLNQSLIPPQLRAARFTQDSFCVIARKNHPHIKKRLTIATFCNLPHVVVSPRTASFTAQTDEALSAIGKQRFVQMSVPYFTLAAEVAAHSDLIAVYPARLAKNLPNPIQVHKLPISLSPFTLKLCWHERMQHDAGHQWFRSQLLEAAK